MKIAVIHWLINDVGGINSWTENFISGARLAGHKVQLYYGSHQKKLGVDPNKKVLRSRRFHLLPGKLLSYHEDTVEQSVQHLNQCEYDCIVFAHPSPHPTKSNTQCSNPRGWKEFYASSTAPKISIFHDRHWQRSNPWIVEVSQWIDYVHAAQYHFLECVKEYAALSDLEYGWGYFPLNIDQDRFSIKKIRRFVLPTQWLSIKNHKHLIPYAMKLDIPLHTMGSGQVYHTLQEDLKRNFREDHHYDKILIYNKKSRNIHYGHLEYSEVLKKMKDSWFCLDLSTQGMTNMTHWEPMSVGSISVMERRVSEDKYCKIPEDCCLVFDLENIIEDLNKIARTPTKQLVSIQKRASRFITRCNKKSVARKILEKI